MLSSIISLSQVIKGSYAIVALCKDGIVIGSDSRGTITIDNIEYAFFDHNQKVFIIRNCVLSITGLIALDKRFIWDYVQEFSQTISEDLKADDLLSRFAIFMQKYPSAQNDLKKLGLISVGYFNGESTMCGVSVKDGKGTCNTPGGIATPDTLSKFHKEYDNEFCKQKTCDELMPIVEKEILEYAKRNNKTNSVGGPISLLKIDIKGNISWIKNKPVPSKWINFNDFVADYKAHKVKLNFIFKEAKKILEDKHFK